MRARYPDREGELERAGATISYAVYGDAGPTILLAQSWQFVHSRMWKFQVAYLASQYRVVTYDPVGNGKSGQSLDAGRYALDQVLADAIAVLDATDTEQCVVIGLSYGGWIATALAALHPERIIGLVALAAAHPWAVALPGREGIGPKINNVVEDPQGWDKYNFNHWRQNWPDFVEFFSDQCASDPHSTKGWDDMVSYGLGTSGEVMVAEQSKPSNLSRDELEAAVRALSIPVLIMHGTGDQIISWQSSEVLASMIADAELSYIEDAGHLLMARHPVKVNLGIKKLLDRVHLEASAATTGARASKAAIKILYISSPIGLGHARRDLAIADELRRLRPDVQIDWLAQDPVTRVLEAAGEYIHPASARLASESAHIEKECGEHSLEVFQALRDMDEILLANFMLIHSLLSRERYDLVVGDEAWEIDYHLHENPDLKKTAFAWLTDFVGYLPMPAGGEREAFVTADYNAEMIGHIARHPGVRDRAIFVGQSADIVPDSFGPGLPLIRDWTEANYDFCGYVTGFDPRALGEKEELRREVGFHSDERVCVVTVGGSAVCVDLILKVVAAYPAAKRAIGALRMIVVTGPRIDPESLPRVPGVEYRSYVDRLFRHLAACDLAIVHGGLATTMELTAAKVPFIYVPIRGHFEQNFHVRARLRRYRAGYHLDYSELQPDHLAEVIARLIGRPVDYEDVEIDGAARAARMLADML